MRTVSEPDLANWRSESGRGKRGRNGVYQSREGMSSQSGWRLRFSRWKQGFPLAELAAPISIDPSAHMLPFSSAYYSLFTAVLFFLMEHMRWVSISNSFFQFPAFSGTKSFLGPPGTFAVTCSFESMVLKSAFVM